MGGQRSRNDLPGAYDPMDDDPIEKSHQPGQHGQGYSNANVTTPLVAPSITVRPEFATITRSMQTVQPLTCIVVVELPTRRNSAGQDADVYRGGNSIGTNTTLQDDAAYGSPYQQTNAQNHHGAQPGRSVSRKPSSIESGQYSTYRETDHNRDQYAQRDQYPSSTTVNAYGQQVNNVNSYSGSASNTVGVNSQNHTSGVSATSSNGDPPNAFSSITEDLRQRVADWKGHPMAGLGPLQMFDILSVRRDVLVREFYVYLFKEAVICVLEEKKKSLGKLLSPTGSADSGSINGSTMSGAGGSGGAGGKGILRLKGRIYIRHIKQVHDTSSAGELSLTIDMEDERLESFILIFRDRATLENWRGKISQLVLAFQQGSNGGGVAGTSNGAGGSLAIASGRVGESGLGAGGESGATVQATPTMVGAGSTANGGSRHGHGGEFDEFGTAPLNLGGREGSGGGSGGGGGGIPNALPKGVAGKAARMLSGSTSNSDGGSSNSASQADFAVVRSTAVPLGNAGFGAHQNSRLGKVASEEHLSYAANSIMAMSMGYGGGAGMGGMGMGVGVGTPDVRTITPHVASSASNSLPPISHPPLDLILVISVPPAPGSPVAFSGLSPAPSPATAQLKVRVIRDTLDFVLGQLGPKDRLSLVTFEVGPGGQVRKTPFLSVSPRGGLGKDGVGRRRLQAFIDGILGPEDEHANSGGGGGGNNPAGGGGPPRKGVEDEFVVRNLNEEKTDVVTAVNHGLDVVLQRKQKNTISGMVLISDAADSTRRAQMDLVLARAEAAKWVSSFFFSFSFLLKLKKISSFSYFVFLIYLGCISGVGWLTIL